MLEVLRVHMSQEASCGSLNSELKCERNCVSSGWDTKECDAKSAIVFTCPGR